MRNLLKLIRNDIIAVNHSVVLNENSVNLLNSIIHPI
jgi:hypothetical protein